MSVSLPLYISIFHLYFSIIETFGTKTLNGMFFKVDKEEIKMAEQIVPAGFKITFGRRRTQVTTYENLILHSTQPIKEDTPKKRKPSIPSDYANFNYYNRMKKRRMTIKELCYNNFAAPQCCMITLTYDTKNGALHYTDLGKSHNEFKKFIQRVNSHYDHFDYIATFSRQKNGNWHYHIMCNFSKEVTNEDVHSLWKNGYTYLTRIEDEVGFKKGIEYLIDNMKESGDEIKSRHGYLCSKSLEYNKDFCSWRKEDSEGFEEAFKEVNSKERKILYEVRRHLGVKGAYINEETGQINEVTLPDRELNNALKNAGYENWESIFTHVISEADFSDKFRPLRAAAPKQPKSRNHKE